MIIFPRNENTKYYKTHYQYLYNIISKFEEVELGPPTDFSGSKFTIDWHGKNILIDFCDLLDLPYNPAEYDYVFKYH